MGRTTLFRLWESPEACRGWRTGVSLHGHTSGSEEDLKFLGGFERQFPIIPAVLGFAAWLHSRATGEALDIGRAGWRPPLDPSAALQLEMAQIHRLGLNALTSLTDHDAVVVENEEALHAPTIQALEG